MRRIVLCVVLIGFGFYSSSTAPARARQGSTPASQIYRGLEINVTGLERASSTTLTDCPPNANVVKGMTRGAEEFAIVTVKMKVLPDYKPAPLKRPVLTDAADKTYNTAASFVDLEKVTEFSCKFPFRVPKDTNVKSLHIETVSFDLTPLPAK